MAWLRAAAFVATFVVHCTALQLTQYPVFALVRPFSLTAFRRFNQWVEAQWAATIVGMTSVFRCGRHAPSAPSATPRARWTAER